MAFVNLECNFASQESHSLLGPCFRKKKLMYGSEWGNYSFLDMMFVIYDVYM